MCVHSLPLHVSGRFTRHLNIHISINAFEDDSNKDFSSIADMALWKRV